MRLQHADVGGVTLRFGGHHFTHAVAVEDGLWLVRRLVLDLTKAREFQARRGRFMPEDAEDLSEPGPVVLQAPSLAELIAALQAAPWPLI